MFARTERLLLRPGWADDAPALAQALNDQAVLRNLARVPSPYGVDDAAHFLARPDDGLPALLIFARTATAPRLVGGVGIHRDDAGAAELGYWIARPFWGLGFATEAARAMLDARHALKLGPLVASHFVDNPGSGRVLSKLGFRATGDIVQRHSVARGGASACTLYVEATEPCGSAAPLCLEAA